MAVTDLQPNPATALPLPSTPRWHHRWLPGGAIVSDITHADTVEIRLTGEIDTYDRYALCDLFTAVVLEGHARLVHVVADDIAFIDLRTLRLIADVRARLRRSGRHLTVTGLRGVYATAWAYTTAATASPLDPAGPWETIDPALTEIALVDHATLAGIATPVPA